MAKHQQPTISFNCFQNIKQELLQQEKEGPSKVFTENVRQSIDDEVGKGENPTEKGRLFLNWVLTRVFNATDDDAENGRLDGPNDHGIDAVLEVHGDEISFFKIFQSKFGTSHSLDAIQAFRTKFQDFLKVKPNDLNQGKLRDTLIDINEKDWQCEAVYVTDKEVEFEESEDFHVYGFRQIVEKLWYDIAEPADGRTEVLTLDDYMKYDSTIIGVISLGELFNFVNRTRKYIFESNIRKFLPTKTKVNAQLRWSLMNEPEEVFYYNNGVTIVVKDIEDLGNNKIKLYEPQIVNGAQTSSIIADIVKGDRLIQGHIQVTIITEDAVTTRNNITKFRNSQNAVKGRDLISLEKIHDSIFGQLRSKLRYFYERQAGAWMALPEKEKEFYTGTEIFNKYLPDDHDGRIPANDAIQAMAAAIEGDPATPYGSVSKYMPGGTQYHKIFVKDMLPDDYRYLFYPYLVKLYCEKAFRYGPNEPNMDEKKYARLLFVTAYFIALKDHIMDKNVDFKKDSKSLDPYFEDFETNKRLLETIDNILEDFFDKTLDIRQDDEGRDKMTLHNFFARHVWNLDAQRILRRLMNRNQALKEIKKDFKR